MEQLLLGDLVISVETAARQAEERGHTLLDEMRILVVSSVNLRFIHKKMINKFILKSEIAF